jgi:hypothetical protein
MHFVSRALENLMSKRKMHFVSRALENVVTYAACFDALVTQRFT